MHTFLHTCYLEQFMLDRPKALCEDCIRKDIVADNVIRVFIASHR